MYKSIFLLTATLWMGLAQAQNDTSFYITGPRTLNLVKVQDNQTLYFSLANAAEVPAEQQATANWDIALKGKNILLNSGGNGGGTVMGQIVTGKFFTTNTAPALGYQPDVALSPTIGTKWMNAEGTTSDKDKLILLKKADGSFAKIEIVDYYQSGTEHSFTIRFLLSKNNDLSQTLTSVHNLFAGNPQYTLFDLATANIIPNADSASSKWNLGFQTTTIITNSGISGPARDSSQVLRQDFATLLEAPATGYNSDNTSSNAIPSGSGNGWYTYDITVHSIKPTANTTLVCKTGSPKNFTKIGIKSYYIGAPESPTFLDISTARYYTFDYFYQPVIGVRNLKAESVTAGIAEKGIKALSLYPNPAPAGQAAIQSPEATGTAVLSVYDLQGRVLSSQTVQMATGATFPVAIDAAGMYTVRLVAADQQFATKLIVY